MPKPELARPDVIITSDLSANTAATWLAVERVNTPPELFRQHSNLVWVSQTENGVRIKNVNHIVLQRFCTDRVVFLVRDSKAGPQEPQYRKTVPPMRLFQNMLAGISMPVPDLSGIVSVPVFTREGVLTTPGYSKEPKLLYCPPADLCIPPVEDYPDASSRNHAKTYILEMLLCDFPFDSDASRAHAVAALQIGRASCRERV